MPWRIRERISDAGRPVNEDGCGVEGNFAWIADGAGTAAPPRFPGTGTDAAWLVHEVARTMANALAHDPSRALSELLDVVEADVRSAWGASSTVDPAGGPTCCLAVMEHWRDDGRADIAVVGDVVLLVPMADESVRMITDERVKPFEAKSLAALGTDPRQHGAMPPAARAQIQANRALMNTADGFPIVCPPAQWVSRMVRGACMLARDKPVVLVTDGFYRLVDVFSRYTDETLYDACAKGHGNALLAELRQTEADDADMSRYPRFKVHDDATLLIAIPS